MSNAPRKGSAAGVAAGDPANEQEGFLSRWSRRKAMSRDGVDLPEPDVEEAPLEQAEPGALAEAPFADASDNALAETTSEPVEAPALPPLDSLHEDSDYSAFLKAGVPPDLQRDALRKLFRSPKFNVRDGLDDYDLDYSQHEPLGNIVTAEMRRRIARELERLAELDETADAPDAAVAAVAADTPEAANDEADNNQEQADSEPDDEQPATA
ncbi:MAG TPA: DUF3306 domain-containing protein [Woeseiaceae bacterium]